MNYDHTVKIAGPVELLNNYPSRSSAVVIANKSIYPKGILFIGSTGDIAVIPAGNPDANDANPTGWVVYKNIPNGTWFLVPVVRVGDIAAGTTATNIVFNY